MWVLFFSKIYARDTELGNHIPEKEFLELGIRARNEQEQVIRQSRKGAEALIVTSLTETISPLALLSLFCLETWYLQKKQRKLISNKVSLKLVVVYTSIWTWRGSRLCQKVSC